MNWRKHTDPLHGACCYNLLVVSLVFVYDGPCSTFRSCLNLSYNLFAQLWGRADLLIEKERVIMVLNFELQWFKLVSLQIQVIFFLWLLVMMPMPMVGRQGSPRKMEIVRLLFLVGGEGETRNCWFADCSTFERLLAWNTRISCRTRVESSWCEIHVLS